MEFTPHSGKQLQLILSDSPITLAATGTQWGKSQAGSLWLKRQIHTFKDANSNFILAAPSYKILQQSALPYFLGCMHGMGEYNKTDAVYHLSKNRHVYIRTETDPDSIVGIPNVKAGWLDEAGKLRLYFWENYQARAAVKGALTLLTTSPYALNWIYRGIIKPKREGGREDVNLIQAASWENPFHALADESKRDDMRKQMDVRRFNMIFGGEWGSMAGLVYDCWDENQNVCEPFNLPEGTHFYAGVDWGFNPDPFVCVVRAVTPAGDHYQVSEFYKTGMTITDMVGYCKKVRQIWGIRLFYCDPSQPGAIEEFNRNGLSAKPADNDINRGIGLHYELIKTRRYKVFQGSSPNTLDEIETYHYPELKDLKPDEASKPQTPVKQADHSMDANRYATIETYRAQLRRPKPNDEIIDRTQETQSKRWKRLMKRPGSSGQTENW